MGWDKGIDFEDAKKRIKKLIENSKENSKSKCYAYILYIQLHNGSRISEALRAAYMFSRNPRRVEVEVELSKTKKKRTRLMVKPEGVNGVELGKCRKVYEKLLGMDAKRASDILSYYAKRRLGLNTHSLRYAFVTKLLSESVSPALVARIVGHRKLDHILTYAQEVRARKLLREFARASV